MACRLDGAKPLLWNNAGMLLIRPHGTYFNEILFEIIKIIQENVFEYVVCEMAAILSKSDG